MASPSSPLKLLTDNNHHKSRLCDGAVVLDCIRLHRCKKMDTECRYTSLRRSLFVSSLSTDGLKPSLFFLIHVKITYSRFKKRLKTPESAWKRAGTQCWSWSGFWVHTRVRLTAFTLDLTKRTKWANTSEVVRAKSNRFTYNWLVFCWSLNGSRHNSVSSWQYNKGRTD